MVSTSVVAAEVALARARRHHGVPRMATAAQGAVPHSVVGKLRGQGVS